MITLKQYTDISIATHYVTLHYATNWTGAESKDQSENMSTMVCVNLSLLWCYTAWKLTIFRLLLFLYKTKTKLMRSPCCLCVCVCPPYQLLNGWTSLYETWYVYHGAWTHLSGVLHKSFLSICVCIVTRQRLGKYVTAENEYTQQ
jgi:hypothetical protein